MPRSGARLAAFALVAGGVVVAAANFTRAGTALVVTKSMTSPDAIVSLASHEWERLPAAARLARRYPDAVVLLTQPAAVTRFNCHDCGNRVHRLELAGIPPGRVRMLKLDAGGTYGEALAVRRWAQTHGSMRVMVVTSPYHTRRTLATFSTLLSPLAVDVGVEAAADSPARPNQWWQAPYDRAYVRYEWAARLYYAVRYGVIDP